MASNAPGPLTTCTSACSRAATGGVLAAAGDVSAAGLVSAEHPLLGAAVSLAGTDGVLFTGRLSAPE
ncbi:hypothetical protein [Streptomyces sp. DHE17-7]|uniref:hypothetical protein n=1 Tax=Streptomyces sp. DHE17-7 TaxID=2759949 RepID=UPI0022EA6FF2|nr:hypothetical protein [Streptomyces sp. DHE17-7]MBJ6617761.1 hypothetical protein [Streptomyces sp. DHE17-7]